jgi:hypothetical protein
MRPAEIDWLFSPQGGAARQNPQAWQNFVDNTAAARCANEDQSSSTSSSNTRSFNNEVANGNKMMILPPDRTVLHQYYDDMFGQNASRRWNAARGWMTWEFSVSASFRSQRTANNSSNNNNDDIPKSPAVLVSMPAGSRSSNWEYQDSLARPIAEQDCIRLGLEDSAENASLKCRQGLPHSSSSTALRGDGPQSLAARHPRPMAMTSQDFVTAQEKAQQKDAGGNFTGLPALPMLTCFYSVNEQYAMHNWNLLSPARMARIRQADIPCIAIQGGRDPICPPDTALDVQEAWPEMELRIPLLAGHSMYHPDICHELVQATDRFGL